MLAVHHIKLHCTLLAVSVWNRLKCILWSTFPSFLQFTRTVYCCHGVHSCPINRMQENPRCICVLTWTEALHTMTPKNEIWNAATIETKYWEIDVELSPWLWPIFVYLVAIIHAPCVRLAKRFVSNLFQLFIALFLRTYFQWTALLSYLHTWLQKVNNVAMYFKTFEEVELSTRMRFQHTGKCDKSNIDSDSNLLAWTAHHLYTSRLDGMAWLASWKPCSQHTVHFPT